MAASPKEFDENIVFVSVDERSLNAVGTWPWSRSIHAALLDRIVDSGAYDVLLDFDFTFPSDPAGDTAFQNALERAGGATYLAVFQQVADAADTTSRHLNFPLSAFARSSWPALVNVAPDSHGLVRTYPYGADLGDSFVMSAGALLSGHLNAAPLPFEIDFSLQPQTVQIISAIDVLNDTLPVGAFDGKIVIVGASAIELSDHLTVPIHGIISAPLIHALATETLLRDLELRWVRGEWVALGMFIAFVLLHIFFRKYPLLNLGGTVLFLVAVEVSGIAAFRASNVMIPSAMLYPAMLGVSIWVIIRSLLARTRLLTKTSSEARNTLLLLERIFDDGSDGIIVFARDGTVIRHSSSADRMLGKNTIGDLNIPDGLSVLARGETLPSSGASLPVQHLEVCTNGQRRILEYRATQSAIELPGKFGNKPAREMITTFVLRDVTKLKEQEQDIVYLSNHDNRTGALRRTAFLSLLASHLENAPNVIVFTLTLDRFKTINITLGRSVGDAILKEVVKRLERSPLDLSTAVRLGGTSFAFYTQAPVSTKDAEMIAHSVVDEIGQVYRLEDANAQIGVRLGYTVVRSSDGTTAEVALEQSENAMDATKLAGINISRYDPSAWQAQKRAREIERAMEAALMNSEYHMVYQPQHRVSDGAMVGVEALIRWHSPTLGWVYPDEFISIAESTGFIIELGKWVLKQSALDALKLPLDLKVAVNVSGVQIARNEFVDEVRFILSSVGLPANRICLELTETVLLASTDTVIDTMQDLRFLGVTWALDDFGTGFSSMQYLSRMPLDKVKLDKSFIMQLGQDKTARPILHSTSELCRGLDVKLLCEGVETEDQLAILIEEGCEEAQGYLFSKPVPIDQLVTTAGRKSIQL